MEGETRVYSNYSGTRQYSRNGLPDFRGGVPIEFSTRERTCRRCIHDDAVALSFRVGLMTECWSTLKIYCVFVEICRRSSREHYIHEWLIIIILPINLRHNVLYAKCWKILRNGNKVIFILSWKDFLNFPRDHSFFYSIII